MKIHTASLHLFVRRWAVGVWLASAPFGVHAVTMNHFVQLTHEQRVYYIVGVIDLETIDATYSFERGQCVSKWGLEDSMQFLVDWYGSHSADDPINEMNVALILKLEAGKVCGYEKVKLKGSEKQQD